MPDVDNFELGKMLLLDPTKWQNKGNFGWRKYIDVKLYYYYYDDTYSVVEAENDDNSMA